MAGFLAPLIGAGIGALSGYFTSPDDNKVGGTITGGLLGGLTGGIGGMASKFMGASKLGTAASNAAGSTGRIASSWNPVTLLKSAYTPDAGGLFNLGMDALPLTMDIANNDVGAKSFTGFAGTMAGTRFGGRELNRKGTDKLESDVLNRASNYKTMTETTAGPYRPFDVDSKAFKSSLTTELINDPKYSKQGYNMAVGMGADMGLYSLTAGMNKPKDAPEVSQAKQQEDFANSPVSRYIQMTGSL